MQRVNLRNRQPFRQSVTNGHAKPIRATASTWHTEPENVFPGATRCLVTGHARRRLRKRVGIPLRSADRQFSLVLRRGRHLISRDLEMVLLPDYPGSVYFQYGSFFYVCRADKTGLHLITVLPESFLPSIKCKRRAAQCFPGRNGS